MVLETEIQAASVALTRLHKIDQRFRDHVKTVGTTVKDLGSLTAPDGEIAASCLEVQVHVARKPIAVDGSPALFEYVFGEMKEGALKPYLRLYLAPSGNLFTDVQCQTRVCDFDNTYIVKNILLELAHALLHSEHFAPTS